MLINKFLQGYDCRVFSDPGLYSSGLFIPYIHMEFNILDSANRVPCHHVVDILMEHGYIPHIQITVTLRVEV